MLTTAQWLTLQTTRPQWARHDQYKCMMMMVSQFNGTSTQFNGTSTPKGSYRAKTGDNDCGVNSSRYSLRTTLCESICYQAKSEQNVRQDLIPRVRHGEAHLMHLSKIAGVKRIQIWDSGVLAEHTWDTLDLIVFKIIWVIRCKFAQTCL